MPDSNREESVLVIRLGAMGDILHALPAVASLKKSFSQARLQWVVARRWMPLLEGNPNIDELIPFDRQGISALWTSWRQLHGRKPALAVDFQGLLQSAIAARFAQPKRLFGFTAAVAREPIATVLYTDRVAVSGPHRIERNLQLVKGAGATELTTESWIPEGCPEGSLPSGPYVLASPFAGWASKQWTLENYTALGKRLEREGLALVLNVPGEPANDLGSFDAVHLHVSGLNGLIHATRGAAAVIGVDSGPLHLAAALKKPGVALYGPTDPAQTGPFGCDIVVLRTKGVETTYKRHGEVHESMMEITVEQVATALLESLRAAQATVAARL